MKASEFLFIAGQVGVDKGGKVVGDDFDAQCVQAFANIEAALKAAGAGWGNIVQFTTYLVHSQDIPKFMEYRLREFPKMFAHGAYPPNPLLWSPAGAGTSPGRGEAVAALQLAPPSRLRRVDHADMGGDHPPAFREFHPGLHLPADLAGRRRPLETASRRWRIRGHRS